MEMVSMEAFAALVVLFVILMFVGIPIIMIAAVAFIAAVLVLMLWVGVELFKLFFYLALTFIISGIVGKIADHFGASQKLSKNLALASSLACIFYFFFY